MLFSQPLLTVNPLEMMRLWGELVECYHGVNGYGRETAEIYAYRLMPYNPIVHKDLRGTELEKNTEIEVNSTAAGALVSLCEEFAMQYECEVTVDGLSTTKWYMNYRDNFNHRCRVKVVHK